MRRGVGKRKRKRRKRKRVQQKVATKNNHGALAG